MYGGGLIADPMQLMTNPAYKDAWMAGARPAGKNPDTMPILLEHFVVIGDEAEARRDAELVRFHALAWKPGYFNNISPAAIQRRAEAEIPLEALYRYWPVSTDPTIHVQAIQNVVNAGVTHLLVHSTQQAQVAVVDFFGRQVLPRIHAGAIKGVRQAG